MLTRNERDVPLVESTGLAQTPGEVRGAYVSSVEGLACMVIVQVPREHDTRPVDGLPASALSCEALISKAKATAREPIRTPLHSCGGEVSLELW